MSVKMRQEIEKKIVKAVLDGAIAAGYSLRVYDGEEIVLKKPSRHADTVMSVMFKTDEDCLLIHDAKMQKQIGWVQFIYGNDGYDVIHDYTVNIESIMAEANRISDYYAD